MRRKDFDPSTFAAWLTQLDNQDRDVWTATTVESLARFQNHNYFLQALTVRILSEPDTQQMEKYRQEVVAVLAKRSD
jgi:hypothetical protein